MTAQAYTGYSRFTDPGDLVNVLEELPDDVDELCAIAERQTIHHNLLGYYGVTPAMAEEMRRVWPPRAADVLAALLELDPGTLRDAREPDQRVVGACMLESHFLAALLRTKGIPTRIRAGYFQRIRDDTDHIVEFWRGALEARGIDSDMLATDPERWRDNVDTLTTGKNEVDHHIEHWLCEYLDEAAGSWRIVDANRAFLSAHSGLDVGYYLPSTYFEYAHRAWTRMRTVASFEPEQYVEDTQDGRSHIRSQLLWDFYSLLNHDLAGIDEEPGTLDFVKEQAYDATDPSELAALDGVAALVASDPGPDRLRGFYFDNEPLRLRAVEADPYSFVSGG